MTTSIQITPNGGSPQILSTYDQCTVQYSATNKAGTFSIQFRGVDSSLVDAFPVGSDVQITQDSHVFRGWILNPTKNLSTNVRQFELSGSDYTAKTQKILVTETYVNTSMSDIVTDLITNYVPWATSANVDSFPTLLTTTFDDIFLWDAMDTMCQLAGADWYIDENLAVNFFDPVNRLNSTILSQAASNFTMGTANIKPDSSKLVNKLWVKGGKAVSNDFTQNLSFSDTTPIPLFYTPKATLSTIIITIGGVLKTVGTQNVDAAGTKDFLINFSEKLLLPDLVTSGTGTIVYNYEYPIKILLEEPNSQAQYGIFEDVYNVQTNDKDIARDLGLVYLSKYSQPVLTGSIEPLTGTYKPGELVSVQIPDLNINKFLKVLSVTYKSVPQQPINIQLDLESLQRNLTVIIKDLNSRLQKLESQVNGTSTNQIERYIARSETENWTESITEIVYACPLCSASTLCSASLIVC